MKRDSNGMNNSRVIFILLLVLIFLPGIVSAESPLVIRPQVGYGYNDSSGSQNSGNLNHVGIRLLLNTGGNKRYGLEATEFNPENGGGFYSLGIVLEQRLWNWFNMSIGTVGYFDYVASSGNPVGLMTNLGWEPNSCHTFKPFITYRSDLIFGENVDVLYSLSAGLSFEL